MNSVSFFLSGDNYKEINILDNDLGTILNYISEGVLWGYLVDPDSKSEQYACGNYYCTKRNEINLYITNFVTLRDSVEVNDQELNPVIINLNSLLGVLVAFDAIHSYNPKLQKFILVEDKGKYTFCLEQINTSIVVDPNLGYLYNYTVPRLIMHNKNRTSLHPK